MLTNNVQDRRLIGYAFFLNLFHVSVIASLWANLPHSLPDHFGFNGNPDHWSSKHSLIIFPVVNTFLCLLCFSVWNKTTYFRLPYPLTEANRSVQEALAKALMGKTVIWICLLFISITWMSISHGLQMNTLPARVGFFATFAGMMLTIVCYFIQAYKNR